MGHRSIPYRYDHNFNLIVDTADLFRSEGFREQLEACMKLELDTIRKQGYEAHEKGYDLMANPYQSYQHKREAWDSGWMEAEADYRHLLWDENDK